MAEVRGVRGVRYDPARVGDVGRVVAPPYDVIGAGEAAALAAGHPANIIRVEVPEAAEGDAPGDRYRRAALTRFTAAAPSPLERREKLEQLRALELGLEIWATLAAEAPLSVDTPDDMRAARAFAETAA